MKTVADYIKAVMESEGAVNTISSGAVETTPTPGKVQKRKIDEAKKDITKPGHVTVGFDHTGYTVMHKANDAGRRARYADVSNHKTKEEAYKAAREFAVKHGHTLDREIKESVAYEGENPLAANIGKFPLATGATAPDVGDDKTDNGHMFKQKQAAQQNYS